MSNMSGTWCVGAAPASTVAVRLGLVRGRRARLARHAGDRQVLQLSFLYLGFELLDVLRAANFKNILNKRMKITMKIYVFLFNLHVVLLIT